MAATGRPTKDEAIPYFFRYIDLIESDDILTVLTEQLEEVAAHFSGISEERSLYRYAPEKWSIRQVVGHMADTERIFSYRALWFARNLPGKLLSFDQEIAVAAAGADAVSFSDHLQDLLCVRRSTLWLFRNMPAEAWMRSGIFNENSVTPRALAYMCAGHMAHHLRLHRELYR